MIQVNGALGTTGESPPMPSEFRRWDGDGPLQALLMRAPGFQRDIVPHNPLASLSPQPGAVPPPRLSGPIQFVVKLLRTWQLSTRDAVGLLGFREEDLDHVEGVLGGAATFRGRDVNDRVANLFWIRNLLRSLFRNLEEENRWMRESHENLDGNSPLSLILGGSMEDLLLVKEYVDWVCRR